MAFTDIEYQAVREEVARFVTEMLSDELDVAFSIEGQTVCLFMVRHEWEGGQSELTITEQAVAEIRYVRVHNSWQVYWLDAECGWRLLDVTHTLAAALEMVREDRHGCFWG